MANYYSDHPEIAFHLDHPLMKRIVDLKERGYADAAQYPDAPIDYEAWTSRDRIWRRDA